MTKAELIEKMAKDAGITKRQATAALNALFEAIIKALKSKYSKVVLPGFGTFKKVHRKARTGRNPQTGEQIEIRRSNVVKFSASKSMIGSGSAIAVVGDSLVREGGGVIRDFGIGLSLLKVVGGSSLQSDKDFQEQKRIEEEKEGKPCIVWFGTNREMNSAGNDLTYRESDKITYGKIVVRIPRAHRFGETGSPWWKKLQRLDFRDDKLKALDPNVLDREVFYNEIKSVMSRISDHDEKSHALVFIHGYNVKFKQAAIRTAQIHADLNMRGASAFFSWPSYGRKRCYIRDLDVIQACDHLIEKFLVEFTENCGAEKVHVIAHSMGNLGTMRAMERIAKSVERKSKVKFGQIILAAPDVERKLFMRLAKEFPKYKDRVTLYASNRDFAMKASQWLREFGSRDKKPRAGFYLPYTTVPGIDTIAVPGFNVDLLGHKYFASAAALLSDIHTLIKHNSAPRNRQRLTPLKDEQLKIWKIIK